MLPKFSDADLDDARVAALIPRHTPEGGGEGGERSAGSVIPIPRMQQDRQAR